MRTAFVRAVPDSFADALTQGPRPQLDVAEARRQHDAYKATLSDAGYKVIVIPKDEAHPDCPFIEDTAVILEGTAVITRPGAASRRGEVEPVAEALGAYLPVARITAPGTLDGGDVMTIGEKVYVGRSNRTNPDGINRLSQLTSLMGLALRPVTFRDVLHLKSAVLPIDHNTVLLSTEHIDPEAFGEFRVIPKAIGEEHLASVLPLADGTLMVTASAPETAASLEKTGYKVVRVDTSQFQAADGGLTCLSILA